MVVQANTEAYTKQSLDALTSVRNDVMNRIRYTGDKRVDLDFLRLEYQKLEQKLTNVANAVTGYVAAKRDQTIQEVVSKGVYHTAGVDLALCKLDRRAYDLVESNEKHVRRDAEQIGRLIRQVQELPMRWPWSRRRYRDAVSYFEPVAPATPAPADGSIAAAIHALDGLGKVLRSTLIRSHALAADQATPERLADDDRGVRDAFERFRQTVEHNLEVQKVQTRRDLTSRGVTSRAEHGRVVRVLETDAEDRVARAGREVQRVRNRIRARLNRLGR